MDTTWSQGILLSLLAKVPISYVEADRGTDLPSLVSESFALDPVVILGGKKKNPLRKLHCDLDIYLFNRDCVKTKEVV